MQNLIISKKGNNEKLFLKKDINDDRIKSKI